MAGDLRQGYLFELERRGDLQGGPYGRRSCSTPRGGAPAPPRVRARRSDAVEAFTYYGDRERLKVICRGHPRAPRPSALQIAKEVADESGALLAVDLSNTNAYEPDDSDFVCGVRQAFEEQVGWAVDAGVDYIVGEIFSWLGQASLASRSSRARASQP